jgi:hypothetical protein
MTLVQPVNETVGGVPVILKQGDFGFDTRIFINYDEVFFLHALKIIHVIDRTDKDFVDFGIPFVTNFFAWVFNVDLNAEKITKGHIYVSSDIHVENRREQNNKENVINLQWYIHPVVFQQIIRCGTPIEAIAKIGGLMIIIRISLLIQFIHELLFDYKMRQMYPRSALVSE